MGRRRKSKSAAEKSAVMRIREKNRKNRQKRKKILKFLADEKMRPKTLGTKVRPEDTFARDTDSKAARVTNRPLFSIYGRGNANPTDVVDLFRTHNVKCKDDPNADPLIMPTQVYPSAQLAHSNRHHKMKKSPDPKTMPAPMYDAQGRRLNQVDLDALLEEEKLPEVVAQEKADAEEKRLWLEHHNPAVHHGEA